MQNIAENQFYAVKVDESKNRIYLRVTGFWKKVADVPEYLNDMQKALGLVTNGFTVVTDMNGLKPPTQEVGALHVKVQKLFMEKGLAKTAEVHPESALAKMTADRVSDESGMNKGMFPSLEEAEKWLDA